MRSTNASFDTYHANDYKAPMYLVHFDGETTDYVNHAPASPSNTVKDYLKSVSGRSTKITPEEGTATVGGVTVELLDYNDEITSLLATDTYFFHRKKTTIKAGYYGMTEANMLTVFTGWVTGLKLSGDGLSYVFSITDPQKWMQRKIFRGAETSNVTLSGNPINILLAVLTSSGVAGTNGVHDRYDAENGLDLTSDFIDITGIEAVRDDWFPGPWFRMDFTINKRVKAKEFIEKEILKPLNCYPFINGDGKYNIQPFKPPLAASETVQDFDEDVVAGLPSWDANLAETVNEVEFHYDYDETDGEYDQIDYHIEATSLSNRGPGKKPITIKSQGLHSTQKHTADIITTRKNRIFERYATPPFRVTVQCRFDQWLSEVGDVVPFTDSNLPDIEAGTRGLSAERMEIISFNIDWSRGRVSATLLNTGFNKSIYGVISDISTDYTASTAAEKLYGFIASASDKLGGTSDDNVLIPGGDGVLLPGGDKLILPGGTGATGGDDAHLIVA